MKIVKKFLSLFSFSFDALSIIFGILQVNKNCDHEKKGIFDFLILSMILDSFPPKTHNKIVKFALMSLYVVRPSKNAPKSSKKSKNRKFLFFHGHNFY